MNYGRVPLSGDVIIVVSIRNDEIFSQGFEKLFVYWDCFVSGILVEVSLKFIGYDSLGIGILRDLGIG